MAAYCLDTPKSILDEYGRDVFAEIIPEGEAFREDKMNALWNSFRFRGIGNCDIDYWVACMQARYFSIVGKFDISWEMWTKFRDSEKDFADSSAESRTVSEHEDNPDNPQGATKYLASRDTNTYSGKTFGGLGSTTAAQYLKDIPNLPQDFAREFRELFFWGM